MIKFLDGPAAGTVLALQRAPLYLRVVIAASGDVDALDQLDDQPEATEAIFAYRLVAPASCYHLLCGGRGRRGSGWYRAGEYRVVAPQPDEPLMRATDTWQTWCYAQSPEYAGPIAEVAP